MRRRFLLSTVALVTALALVGIGAKHTVADERDFVLINNSSVVLTHVYVAPSASNSWEEDILGQDVLNPGDQVTIHFSKFDGANTCTYDILVKGKNDETGEIDGVDLCSTDTVTFS